MMATDTLFVIGLMIVVSLVWGILTYPSLHKRLPTIYLITRSWWWMLAILCGCYLIAKISVESQSPYPQYLYHQHPYQWVLVAFFMLIGLRSFYEIARLRHPKHKQR